MEPFLLFLILKQKEKHSKKKFASDWGWEVALICLGDSHLRTVSHFQCSLFPSAYHKLCSDYSLGFEIAINSLRGWK